MSRFRHLSYRTCQRLPFFSAILATILAGILLVLDFIHGSNTLFHVKVIYEILVVTIGFFLIFAFSWILHFCWSQLFGILYTYIFFICLWLGRYPEGQHGIFGSYLIHIHAFLFIIGLIYTIFVIHIILFDRHCNNNNVSHTPISNHDDPTITNPHQK